MKPRKPLGQRYECPDCEKQFFYQPESTADDGPKFCPKCGVNLADNSAEVIEITRVNINTSVSKKNDTLYRQMETASAGRAEEAADMLGIDKSETSGMKITDMNDGQRPGDIAAKLPANPVVEAMKNSTSMTGFQHPANVSEYVHSAPSGDRSGVTAMIGLNNRFMTDRARLTNAGRINK